MSFTCMYGGVQLELEAYDRVKKAEAEAAQREKVKQQVFMLHCNYACTLFFFLCFSRMHTGG